MSLEEIKDQGPVGKKINNIAFEMREFEVP